ncbi:hypothetical protein CB1_002312001 [Camelus ferus]|nr:hypothetical protein CB1_002312001 [Camelus ferus]
MPCFFGEVIQQHFCHALSAVLSWGELAWQEGCCEALVFLWWQLTVTDGFGAALEQNRMTLQDALAVAVCRDPGKGSGGERKLQQIEWYRFESSSHAISMSAYLREQRRELYSRSGELQVDRIWIYFLNNSSSYYVFSTQWTNHWELDHVEQPGGHEKVDLESAR